MNDDEARQKIAEIIHKHTTLLPRVRVFLFGSRASGHYTARSDFDIGLESTAKIPLTALARIRAEIDQLPILQKVDLVDFKRVSPEFAQQARQQLEEW